MYLKTQNHYQKLTLEATKIKGQLVHLPEGKLICVQNGNYVK